MRSSVKLLLVVTPGTILIYRFFRFRNDCASMLIRFIFALGIDDCRRFWKMKYVIFSPNAVKIGSNFAQLLPNKFTRVFGK